MKAAHLQICFHQLLSADSTVVCCSDDYIQMRGILINLKLGKHRNGAKSGKSYTEALPSQVWFGFISSAFTNKTLVRSVGITHQL